MRVIRSGIVHTLVYLAVSFCSLEPAHENQTALVDVCFVLI